MVEETEQTNDAPNEKVTGIQLNDSKYRKIILAAQRSKQLQRGADPRVDLDPRKTKSTRIAMRELEEGKVDYEILSEK